MGPIVSNYAFEDIGVHKCAIEKGSVRSFGLHRQDKSLQIENGVVAGAEEDSVGRQFTGR